MPADPTITDKAVEAAARASFVRQSDFDSLSDVAQDIERATARRMLKAALPHLVDQPATTGDARALAVDAITRELKLARSGEGYEEEAVAEELVRKLWPARPRLASGDIPITDRTPHGVWIADGPDPAPHPNPDLPDCDGLASCDSCRAYDELRQHLVEQITLLDQQRQDETAALRAELERIAQALDDEDDKADCRQFPGYTHDDGCGSSGLSCAAKYVREVAASPGGGK